jgi:two-component system, cell cycle sensor histidine kinase and response regulator CckA
MNQTSTELREFVTQGVLVTDAELTIQTWNYWLELHTGYSPADVVGRNLLAVYPELAERGYDKFYERVLAGEFVMLAQRFHHYLLPMPAPGAGADLFPHMQQTARIAPLKKEGQVSGTMTIIEDVTERVAREAELVRQVTALQTLQEIDQAILTLELNECLDRIAEGTARLVDAPLAVVVLRENERLVSAARYGNLPPDVAFERLERTAAGHAVSTGEAIFINDVQTIPEAEHPELLDPANCCLAALPLLVNGVSVGALLVESPQAGAFDRYRQDLLSLLAARAAVAIDHARLHQSLRRSEEQLRLLVDSLPQGVVLLDDHHTILLANRAAAEFLPLLGAAGELGSTVVQLGDQPLGEIVAATATGSWLEVGWIAEQGPLFQVAAWLLTGNDESRYLLVLRDVTHEAQLERQLRQQERLAAVGQLAAGIAHDFNNIVASIILYTELMLREKQPAANAGERLRTIHRQAERAAHLVRQILDFSRQSIIEHKPIDLTRLVQEVVMLLKRTLPANIRLEFEPGDEHHLVKGDAGRLEQALLNLAVNAQEAMPEGGTMRLGLSLCRLEEVEEALLAEMETGDWIRLEFSDTGPGIAPEALPHIFEPFFTTKPPAESTGLGLSQVYGILRQHGGHITAANLPQGGALFTIYLPPLFEAGQKLEPQSHAWPLPGETAPPAPATLLLVEDDPVLRQVLLEMLSEAAVHVLTAGDGRQALQLFAEHRDEIDVVLADLVMPDMNGLNLCHMLQKQAPDLRVVLMSGYPINDEIQAQIEQEQLQWLQKPFTAEQLAERIRPPEISQKKSAV